MSNQARRAAVQKHIYQAHEGNPSAAFTTDSSNSNLIHYCHAAHDDQRLDFLKVLLVGTDYTMTPLGVSCLHSKHTIVKSEPNSARFIVKCCLDDILSSSDADGSGAPESHRRDWYDET